MKRTQLRSKDVRQELEMFNVDLSKKDRVELIEDELTLLRINDVNAFFKLQKKWIPTLRYLQTNNVLKKVVIDMGAIKFLIGGADVMRPGIVEIDESIVKNEVILIVDINNQKPIAVGIALLSGEEIKVATSGKVIKNIHYVGDKIWQAA